MRDENPSAATFVAHLFAASTHMSAPRLGGIRCPTVLCPGHGYPLPSSVREYEERVAARLAARRAER